MKTNTKLNLGCGQDYLEDYINCDSSKYIKTDMVFDLEDELGLPFRDNYAEEILIYHTLEHIRRFIPLMKELNRICKKGAIIKIKTPFYSAWGQYNDPTHVRFFTPFTFDYFKKGTYSHEVGCNKDMFKKKKVRIVFAVGNLRFMNMFFNPLLNISHRFYCRFFAWILPASEIYYELEVLK